MEHDKKDIQFNKDYLLHNLTCAHCASQIETKLNNMDGIKLASINFIKMRLKVEYINAINSPSHIELEKKMSLLIQSIENDVTLSDWNTESNQIGYEDHNHRDNSHHKANENSKRIDTHKIFRLILGFSISMIAILLKIKNPLGIILILTGYLLLGFDVLSNSFKSIKKGQIFDENFLMMIATIAALLIKEYPEAIAVMLLYQIGEFLQDMAVNKSRRRLESAMDLKPEYANIKTPNGIERVSPQSVYVDDIIIIKPSEKIPLDGVVVEGTSYINTSSLTGESFPRKVSPGETILSGCLNGSNTLYVKVSKTYSNSTVSKVLDLIENASSKKSSTENFITKFARVYTPTVVIVAILLAIVPPIVTSSFNFTPWIYKACGFLVVSCPCALVISVPLGFFGGIGCASKHGILIKGSNYLEALNSVDTAVFDKTGTLTKGIFTVTDINTSDNIASPSIADILNGLDAPINDSSSLDKETFSREQMQLFKIAALIESFSTHPIAKSIVNAYNNPLDTSIISNYEEIGGLGIKAQLGDNTLLLGNVKLLDGFNIIYDKADNNILGTPIYIAINNLYLGYVLVSDTIKTDAKDGISTLENMGIKTVMLTGDSSTTANSVATTLGINSIYSELLPVDKVDKLEELLSTKRNKGKVLFVGDGINDAPVLARADIGIAMGGIGSDAAIECADIVIMTDEPSKIPLAIKIAKYTRKIVTQNIVLSLGIKLVVLFLLAIGYGSMWLAIFADVGVSLIAIINSIRALNYK